MCLHCRRLEKEIEKVTYNRPGGDKDGSAAEWKEVATEAKEGVQRRTKEREQLFADIGRLKAQVEQVKQMLRDTGQDEECE